MVKESFISDDFMVTSQVGNDRNDIDGIQTRNGKGGLDKKEVFLRLLTKKS